MPEMTAIQVRKIQADHDFWKSFEYDHWVLVSFSDMDRARYGWREGGCITKYVNIRANEARFLLGVDVDLFDQFLVKDNHIED
jgi:hypothetical protein